MIKKITADKIYTLSGAPLENHCIVVDEKGKILEIAPLQKYDPTEIIAYKGIIIPGFVNTHCHLELSHMKGLIPTGTGLLTFIKNVVKHRHFPEEVIQHAIAQGDQEMYDAGIVAVGDISNKIDTAETKRNSSIRYYTFVEFFDFMQPHLTDSTIENYADVYAQQADEQDNKKSMVPHAPYSVSDAIYDYLNIHNPRHSTISIHNQETPDEKAMFLDKTGGFPDFYKGFDFSMEGFSPTGKSSIHYAMERMDPEQKTLFVHNTLTSSEDIAAANAWSKNVYWATCPNANLYIENRLPNYQSFIDANAKMTIGTDSLTSNWQLSIWEEIKTIKRYKSFIDLDTLLTWACKNGAEALGYENLGTIEIGKTPGLVNITSEGDIFEGNVKRIL